MARVLVTEELAERGLARLRDEGHDVDVRLGLSPEALLGAVAGAAALIIRSETKVTAEVLAAGTDLVVVGRAGVGLDNVDVAAATQRGVMVCNAPLSNIVTAAEHTMALLLAAARNVPQADAALKAGKWERSKWTGVELQGKTLGLLGLGRIGTLVAQRAYAFGMRLVAWDPWMSPDRARKLGVELLELEDVVRQADFISIHLLKTPESVGLVGEDLLAHAKPTLRIVNVARGGIIDEAALAAAVADGRVAGAAIDVFAKEPTTESPLFGLPSVVVTPHLGASTVEAQDKAGETIAEQVSLALAGEFVPYAVNVDASEAAEAVRPFLPLAERLVRIWASIEEGGPKSLSVDYQGQLADYDTRILTLAVLKGVLGADGTESVSYVNAPRLAEAKGLDVQEFRTTAAHDYVNLITLQGDGHSVAGSLFGLRNEARLVMVDEHTVDIPPARHMVMVRNDDRPGMIGVVGATLGRAGLNISDMDVGRSPSGAAALMVLSTDRALPPEVAGELRAADGILHVATVDQE
ncbi:MAG TPA: phosphoglycerate dehydrogenase [Acidimicrobiales bacterium]|nr:phosphoglycerate dehydrogenase [Acidimicrobiales bacterium]